MLWLGLYACAPAPPSVTLGTDRWDDSPLAGGLSPVAPPSEPGAATVLVNEVMPKNDSTVMNAAGGFPDWIELYNGSDAPVPLASLSIVTDDGAWVGGEGEIAPGGVYLLEGELTLDADGDHVDLLQDGVLVDALATGAMEGDVVWGRYPDGGAWALSIRATPGWTNGSDPGDSHDPSDVFYNWDALTEIHIGLDTVAYNRLASDPYTEVPGTLAFEAAYFPDVHVRRKGVYGSLRDMSAKAAFKIDVNDTGHMIRGKETVTVNNMVQDPTYVHEALTYEVFRAAGVPAPRTGFSHVYVNDDYYGLYVNVETVDDELLERWFGDTSGNLYEGAYGVDFYSGYEGYFECDQCANPDDRSDLTAVIDLLNRTPSPGNYEDLQDLVDMDEFLRYMAVEAMLWHWDGYTTANNYRVYHDPQTDRFSMIPWGTDQTWVDEWYGPFDARGRLFTWCIATTPCLVDYLDAMDEVADVMDSLDVDGDMDHLLDWLGDDITADPRKEWSQGTRRSYLENTRSTIATTAQRMRDEAAARR